MEKNKTIEEIQREIAASAWLDEKQASIYANVTVSALQSWRHQSRGFAYTRAGRKILYKKTDIDKYLEGNRVEVAAS